MAVCSDRETPSAPEPGLDPAIRDLLTAHAADPLLLFHLPARLSDPTAAAELEAALTDLARSVESQNSSAVRRALDSAAAGVAAYRSATGASDADRVTLSAIELYLAQGEAILEGRVMVLPNLELAPVRDRRG